MTLTQMRDVDVRSIDASTLIELTGITIDTDLPPSKRKAAYMRQVGNPYCVLVNGVPVKMAFMGNVPITERLESAFAKA